MSERSGGRLDTSVIAAGGLASGALALGTALLLKASVGTEGVGPTAATLSDASSALFGAAIGLAAGSASVAFAARTGPADPDWTDRGPARLRTRLGAHADRDSSE